MTSKSFDLATILKALSTLRAFLEQEWTADNEQQRMYLNYLSAFGPKLETFSDIKGFASFETSQINHFLTQNGQPGDFPELGIGDIGATSIFDLLMNWQVVGEKTTIYAHDGNEYPAFSLPADQVRIFNNVLTQGEVLRIQTVLPGSSLFICTSDKLRFDTLSGLNLVKIAMSIMDSPMSEYSNPYKFVNLPMIDYGDHYAVSDLHGMRIGVGSISNAEQRMLFRMNEKGARMMARTDINVSFCLEDIPPSYTVTTPFLAFVGRSAGVPFGTVYCDYDVWKEPAEL